MPEFQLKRIPLQKTDSLNRYFSELSMSGLSTEEEARLCKNIKNKVPGAVDSLVVANLRFVVSVARNYQNQGMDLEDLVNEGNLGLIRAAHRFDSTKNFRFISYAVWWIRQSILQALAEQSRVTRLPLNRTGQIHKLGKSIQRLEQKYKRTPTISEIAEDMGIEDKEVVSVFYSSATPAYLDAPVSASKEVAMKEVFADPHAESPEERANADMSRKTLMEAISSLSDREKEILTDYYGLNGHCALTLEEIGVRLNLTRERVRQIKDVAQIKLRKNRKVKSLLLNMYNTSDLPHL